MFKLNLNNRYKDSQRAMTTYLFGAKEVHRTDYLLKFKLSQYIVERILFTAFFANNPFQLEQFISQTKIFYIVYKEKLLIYHISPNRHLIRSIQFKSSQVESSVNYIYRINQVDHYQIIMKFNVFDFYLFLMHRVTMYCPPIDHERFKREYKSRYKSSHSGDKQRRQSQTEYGEFDKISLASGSRLLSIVSRPIKVYKSIKSYHMIGDINMILQVLHLLLLFHIFIKSIIYTVLENKNNSKEIMRYLDSIYYPHIAETSSRPYVLIYLILGLSSFCLLIKIIRIRNVIDISLKNADEYTELKVSQINNSYLATFNLTFEEWITLWKYINKHGEYYHSNKAVYLNHLELNSQVQQKLTILADRDALFYVNPIDYEKCCLDLEILANYEKRVKRYKNWHVALPIDRTSLLGLREILIAAFVGSMFSYFGVSLALFGMVYLDLKSEFPNDYSPSIQELFSALPLHWFNLVNFIRTLESFILVTSQVLNTYDIVCANMDVHTITSRLHKMILIFKNHLEFAQIQTEFKRKGSKSNDEVKKQRQILSLTYNEENVESNSLDSAFNSRIQRDIASVRLIYYEFLNINKYHTEYFNLFVLGGGLCAAYTIPVFMSNPISAESLILIPALMSSVLPMISILLHCARMERTVSCFYRPPVLYFNVF